MRREATGKGSVSIEQRMDAPAPEVARYVGYFRNAREWMVGVESVESLGDDSYRLSLETPFGTVEPEVNMLEHGESRIRWIYTSAIEGGGQVDVIPEGNGCLVTYLGEFHLKRRLIDRAARLAGMERFARKNGERSLMRLKSLMEARRYL